MFADRAPRFDFPPHTPHFLPHNSPLSRLVAPSGGSLMKLLCSALVILSGWFGVCALGLAAEPPHTHLGVDKRRAGRPATEPDQEQRDALQSLKARTPD